MMDNGRSRTAPPDTASVNVHSPSLDTTQTHDDTDTGISTHISHTQHSNSKLASAQWLYGSVWLVSDGSGKSPWQTFSSSIELMMKAMVGSLHTLKQVN